MIVNNTFVTLEDETFAAFSTFSVFISLFTVFREFDTFVITVEVITFFTTFTDLFTAFNFGTVPFVSSINPSVFFTMIVNNTFVTLEDETFAAFSTFSVFVSLFAVFWEFDTFVVTVKVVTLVTTLTDLFAAFDFIRVSFLVCIDPNILSTMVIDFNTDTVLIEFISIRTLDTFSL